MEKIISKYKRPSLSKSFISPEEGLHLKTGIGGWSKKYPFLAGANLFFLTYALQFSLIFLGVRVLEVILVFPLFGMLTSGIFDVIAILRTGYKAREWGPPDISRPFIEFSKGFFVASMITLLVGIALTFSLGIWVR